MSYAPTAADISKLREMTACGLLDCKKALVATSGDFDAAADQLRKQGLSKAAKKADRESNDGLVAVHAANGVAALVHITCETDFVANTDKFKDLLAQAMKSTLAQSTTGDVTAAVAEGLKETLNHLIATIGENMTVARAERWTSSGKLGCYLHAGGKVGVIVDIEGESSDETLKYVGMHIAAFSPEYVRPEEVSPDFIARERDIASEKTKGKPADMAEKIIAGALAKRYTEVCFDNQPWILDDKLTFSKAYPKARLKRFVAVRVGAKGSTNA